MSDMYQMKAKLKSPIAAKTLSNYTNHLFATPVDKVFQAREFKVVQFAARVFNRFRK